MLNCPQRGSVRAPTTRVGGVSVIGYLAVVLHAHDHLALLQAQLHVGNSSGCLEFRILAYAPPCHA